MSVLEDTVATPRAGEWSITLAGKSYPLVPTMERLRNIERCLGESIFSLVEQAASGALRVDQMTAIAVGLVVAPKDDPLFRLAQTAQQMGRGTGPSFAADGIAEAILAEGLMSVLPILLVPLATALRGKQAA